MYNDTNLLLFRVYILLEIRIGEYEITFYLFYLSFILGLDHSWINF